MRYELPKKSLMFSLSLVAGLFLTGCNTTTTTTNTNAVNRVNMANGNVQNANSNENSAVPAENSTASVIEAKEPEKYQAKVSLKLEATGENNNAALPSLTAAVARDGANKRMEFSLPNGQKLVYLETGTKNLVILPDKKQFAELTKEAVGFDVRSLMTPEQIVKRAKTIKGMEKTGEEKYAGREAVKYQYSAETKTNTKAGEVATQSVVFVDKETGLPLKTEIVSESQNAEVKGFKGIRIVTEMSDIKTDVSEDLFKEPEGFEKIEEQQIRNQINLVFQAAQAILQQMMQNAGGN